MAFIGLLALDIGAVIWSYIWIFNSTTKWQDRIAMIFFVIDMSGVALTSITDSLLYGDGDGVMLAMLEPMTMVIIPIIIISNVIAGIVYHFASAETRARRTQRQLEARARDEEQRQNDEELQLFYAQQALLRKQAELPRKIALANLKIAQDQLEKEAMQALFGNGDIERAMGGSIGAQAQTTASTSANLTDMQAQLEVLKSLGVQIPATAGVSGAGRSAPINDKGGNSLSGKLNPANWKLFGKKDDEAPLANSPTAPPEEAKEPSPNYRPTAEELAQSDDTALTGEENDEGVFIPKDGGNNESNPTTALSA